MIKDINVAEIGMLKRRLKNIKKMQKVFKGRSNKTKHDIGQGLLNMQMVNKEELEDFYNNKSIFLIEKYKNSNTLYRNLEKIFGFKTKVSKDIVEDFMNKKLSFFKAIDTYLSLNAFSLIEIENLEDVLYEYFDKDNFIDKKIIDNIRKISFKYSKDYSDEEYEYRVERYFEDFYPPDILDDIIFELCKVGNIEFEKEFYSDIIFYVDSIDSCYIPLSESCKPVAEDYGNSDSPEEELVSSYGENPSVFCFKGLTISDQLKDAINFKVSSYDNGGFATEIFTKGNNTYLTISENLYLEVINEKFLLLIASFLINEGGKLNAN